MLRIVHSIWACKNDPFRVIPCMSNSVCMQPNAIGAGISKPHLSANKCSTDFYYILPCKISFFFYLLFYFTEEYTQRLEHQNLRFALSFTQAG